MKEKLLRTLFFIIRDIKTYGIGIGIYLIYYFLTIRFFKASCPAILISGYPCPGCGMLRCFKYISRGQFKEAFLLNPSVYVWLAFFIWIIITRYILAKEKKLLTNVFLAASIISSMIVYIYGMANYFGEKIPYVYTQNNFINFVSKLFS